MISLETRPDGILLRVRAYPGARRAELQEHASGSLKVAVTQPPEKGKANAAIVALLSKKLKLRKSQIALVSGQTAQEKRILIQEIEADELRARLTAALGK